jgi:hypothetical protein
MSWLLWILCLGDPSGGGGAISAVRLPRLASPAMQVVFVLLLAAAAFVAWHLYRREAGYVPRERKRLLSGLRFGAYLVVLFMLTGAFLELTRTEEIPGNLLVLIDSSQSMGIVDRRTEPADQAAARAILGAARAKDADQASRSELVKGAFANPALDPLPALGERFVVDAFTFGKSSSVAALELAPNDSPGGALAHLRAPTDDATQLGSALLDAARRAKGRKLDGVVVISDGGSNRGEDALEAAKSLGAPVYAIGVGLPQPKDLEIPFLFCDDVLFKDDRFLLDVRIRQRGYGGRSATLVIKRIDEQKNEEVVKEEQVQLDDQLERVHTVELTADRVGTFTYAAELKPFADEADVENNRRAKAGIRVIDKKIRVLLVDDTPRYLYRFLKSILEADRQRIAPTYILRQGDAGGQGAKTLAHFPASLAELRSFDVVVLGDVAADFFSPDEMRSLEQFVRVDGGGLFAVAGDVAMPSTWVETPLARMLPVEIDAQPTPTLQDELARTIKAGFRVEITPEGARCPALRFSSDAGENELEWQQSDLLLWLYPSRAVKPGATVLMTHPELALGEGRMPILASQRYGKGQVLYCASDDVWRWRFHPGAAPHRRLWSGLISSLAMAHLLGSSERAQVETDRGEYAVGDHAQIIARLLDADFNPVSAETVTATVERELGRESVVLEARSDQPGVFVGDWIPTAPGRWRISIDSGGETGDHVVTVGDPRIEFEDIGQRQELLTSMAAVSGGAYLPLDRIGELAPMVANRPKTSNVRHSERTLWNAPGVMLLLTLLLGAEWFIRKRSDLL